VPAVRLDHLRRYAVARSLFAPTTLGRALVKLGFVQADPIRAPARAQDLILRHRVKNYRARDLERRYARLAIEEGFFVNYGFLSRAHYAAMHPRVVRGWKMQWHRTQWNAKERRLAGELLAFIRERRSAHPREIEARFAHGRVRNYWGGMSNATTHLLQAMHFRGLLRVARRDDGIRVYAAHEHAPGPTDARARDQRLDALVDLMVATYAPLPAATLSWLVSRLRYGTPQWRAQLKPTLARTRERLAHAKIEGVDWYWPANERPGSSRHRIDERVRLLSPFDPVVWDRRRFELLWGWTYRFEAYTPAARRKLGYYALPLLWRDQVIGWANASVEGGRLRCELGFSAERPRDPAFERELEAELARMQAFL
jgi:uncharacterized protein